MRGGGRIAWGDRSIRSAEPRIPSATQCGGRGRPCGGPGWRGWEPPPQSLRDSSPAGGAFGAGGSRGGCRLADFGSWTSALRSAIVASIAASPPLPAASPPAERGERGSGRPISGFRPPLNVADGGERGPDLLSGFLDSVGHSGWPTGDYDVVGVGVSSSSQSGLSGGSLMGRGSPLGARLERVSNSAAR